MKRLNDLQLRTRRRLRWARAFVVAIGLVYLFGFALLLRAFWRWL